MSRDSGASYYDAGGIETLDIIRSKLTPEQFEGFLLGNTLKYLCRYNFKHTDKEQKKRDIEKAEIYLSILKKEI